MTAIECFITDKMSGYIAGGMRPQTAARFTRGELLAIYRRQHHSRDESGAWQITPPLENIPATAAMKKADEAIAEILKVCREQAPEITAVNTHTSMTKKTGLEGLKKYIGATA